MSMIVKDGDTLTLMPLTTEHPVDDQGAVLERMPSLDRSAAEAMANGISRVRLVSNGTSKPYSDDGSQTVMAQADTGGAPGGSSPPLPNDHVTQEGHICNQPDIPAGTCEPHKSSADERRKCTCRSSRCVKLYCVCWAAGEIYPYHYSA